MLNKFLIFLLVFKLTGAADMSYRLPNTTIPLYYNIWLTSEELFYNGELTILVEVLENTPEIVVHSKNLAVSNVYLFDENFEIIEYNLDTKTIPELEIVVATPKKPLVKGQRYNVFINFLGGTTRRDGKGLFRSYYDSEDGKSWSTAFHAAPIYAREVFPCFDEPQFKSRFLMKIMHRMDRYTISNMPLNITTTLQDFYTISWFQVSNPMPVSQIGFLVSNFYFIEAEVDSVTLRVFATKKTIESKEAKHALETAEKLFRAFESFIEVPVKLTKIDFAAVESSSKGK